MHKLLTLSFDDGVRQDVRLIELLNRLGLRATFNLNSALLGRIGRAVVEGVDLPHERLEARDVRAVYAGHEIAAHTLHHPLLTQLPEDEIAREVEEDRLRLSELAGCEVTSFAYPGGGINHDERVIDVLARRTGVKCARTIVSTGRFDLPERPLKLCPTAHWREVDEALLARWEAEGGLLFIWGHAYEMDLPGGWARAESLLTRLAHEPDVRCLTTGEMLAEAAAEGKA